MTGVRAICFDLDDTLRDPSGARDALRRTCESMATLTGLDAEVLLAANGRIWPRFWLEVEDAWTLGAMSGEAVTAEAWRRTLQACGHDDPASARRAAEIHLERTFQSQRLFDDARSLLDALDPGLATAVITNGASDTQRAVLGALGIEARFDAVIVSGEVGVAKPDPAIFELALGAMGVNGDQAWHVGDNIRIDVAGARAAGLTAVWLNRDGGPPPDDAVEADLVVSSLLELTPHLAARAPLDRR